MRLCVSLPILLFLPSCATFGHASHHGGHGGSGAVLAALEIFSAVVQIAEATERIDAAALEVAPEPPLPPPPPAPPPSWRAGPSPVLASTVRMTTVPIADAPSGTSLDTPPGTLPGMPRAAPDPSAARKALNATDVASCSARGVPTGYGHATIVFSANGSPSSVTVDTPSGISPGGLACLGDAFGRARMPAFTGGAVSVGTTWFVSPSPHVPPGDRAGF